jgi:hypothetical protein
MRKLEMVAVIMGQSLSKPRLDNGVSFAALRFPNPPFRSRPITEIQTETLPNQRSI